MNKTPSILVDTGFEVDQNGALTEVVIPSVVATLDTPKKVTFNGTTLNYIPSTAEALQEINCPNVVGLTTTQFKSYTALIKANFPGVTSLSMDVNSGGVFYGCTLLQEVVMSKLVSVTSTNTNVNENGIFRACTSLTTVTMPLLATTAAQGHGSGMFYGCKGLSSIDLPSFTSAASLRTSSGMFYDCTGLSSVTLGSEGHAVTSLNSTAFGSCTQSGLTITIYTSGGTALSGSPWGATNATIIYEEA